MTFSSKITTRVQIICIDLFLSQMNEFYARNGSIIRHQYRVVILSLHGCYCTFCLSRVEESLSAEQCEWISFSEKLRADIVGYQDSNLACLDCKSVASTTRLTSFKSWSIVHLPGHNHWCMGYLSARRGKQGSTNQTVKRADNVLAMHATRHQSSTVQYVKINAK